MVPDNLLYTKEHEWIKVDGDEATIGITDYAQQELGDIVFLELPEKGDSVEQMKGFGTIEAVKAVSDIFSPLSGEITDVNEMLESSPGIINDDPYGEGWIIKIKVSNKSELDALVSPEDYAKLIGE